MHRSGIVLVAILVMPACEPERPEAPDDAAALLAADSAFAREVATGGAAAWASWFEEEGSMVRGDGEVVGRPSIREAMEPALSDPNISMEWSPQRAIRAEGGGDLGATIGSYRVVTGDGTVLDRGMYLTLWRRQDDGSWRVAADIGAPATDG